MIRQMTSNLILVTCLCVRVTTVLAIGPPYWLLVRNPAAYLLPVPVRVTLALNVDLLIVMLLILQY